MFTLLSPDVMTMYDDSVHRSSSGSKKARRHRARACRWHAAPLRPRAHSRDSHFAKLHPAMRWSCFKEGAQLQSLGSAALESPATCAEQ
jgi:hypothetical protein